MIAALQKLEQGYGKPSKVAEALRISSRQYNRLKKENRLTPRVEALAALLIKTKAWSKS